MTYTLWHRGILMGDADLEQGSRRDRHRAGAFRPTEYGLSLLPRLTGIITAARDLKSHFSKNGLDPNAMSPDEVVELLDTTPAGEYLIDLGRILADVELRGPDGGRLDVESMAFTDMTELQVLARGMGPRRVGPPRNLPPAAPRYLVSATLRDGRDRERSPVPPWSWPASN